MEVMTEAEIKSPFVQEGAGKALKKECGDNNTSNITPRIDSETVKQAELSLLNMILKGEASFEDVGLSVEDFYINDHGRIYGAMAALHGRGEEVSVLSVCNELANVERADGGAWSSYLINVVDVALPAGGVDYPVRVIREASRNRRLEEAGYRLHEAARGNDTEGVKRWSERVVELQARGEIGAEVEGGGGPQCVRLAHCSTEPVNWLIDGLVPEGFPSYLYAREGLGKSFLAALLAVEVCRGGGSFMGHSYLEEPVNVLYVDYELSSGVHVERGQKIARGLNLPGIPENLFYINPEVPIMAALPDIKKLIARNNIGFIIVDAWQSAGLDSFDPAVAAAYFAAMRGLGVASLTIDHEKKSQNGIDSGGDSFYGGVHKLTQSRSGFRLTRTGDGKNPVTLLLRQTKNSFGPLAEDMTFDVNFEGDRISFTQSNAPNPEDRDCELIAKAIAEMEAEGARVNRTALTEYFAGLIGQKRLRLLLDKGDGELWESSPGDRTERLYKSRPAEWHPYKRGQSASVMNTVEGGEDCGYPEVLNG